MKIKIQSRTASLVPLSYTYDAPALDVIVAKHTAFSSFQEMLNPGGVYRPSIYLGGKTKAEQVELLSLSLAYNQAQKDRSDGRRVHKGDWRPVFRKEFPILEEYNLGPCGVPGCEDMACDMALISINNARRTMKSVCRNHFDAAQEDRPPKTTPETIVAELEPIAIAAVLADKKVKLLAKVNHQDNFAGYYARIAHDAMVSHICTIIDGKRDARYNAWCDWFNEVCKNSDISRSKFDAYARSLAAKAYAKLYPERCKS